ncbi:hypothetical protein KAI04_00355 [Candidatus Pacearchaeota archaeon]|nr:hypothetical protein [Candidatus Pacearchaeota archaeon]
MTFIISSDGVKNTEGTEVKMGKTKIKVGGSLINEGKMSLHETDLEDKTFTRKERLKGLLIIGAMSLFLIYNVHSNIKYFNERNKLYNELKLVADINNDNLTDHNEWTNVYHSMGLEYDVHFSKPKKDLSNRNMRKYLGCD